MKTELTDHQDTRERLVETAGQIFARLGYRAATVREICQAAKANVAAINYHFGDKERLYIETVRYAHAFALEHYPCSHPGICNAPPEERLAFFIRAFMRRMFDPGRPAWHGRLMAREMAEPTGALDVLVETSVRPQFELLNGIVGELLPSGTSQEEVTACARSVLGQCLFYHFARPVLERLADGQPDGVKCMEYLSKHITEFSLIAIRGWKRRTPVDATSRTS